MSLKGKSSGDIGHEATDGRSPYDQQVGREATSKRLIIKDLYKK